MSDGGLNELLELAAGIMELDDAEQSLRKGHEWRAAKKQHDSLVEAFDKVRKNYVDGLLTKGEDWSHISAAVSSDLENIQSRADSSWHPSIDYTRNRLLPYLSKELGRPPIVREVIRWTPWALAGAAAIVYFSVRLTSSVEVGAPLSSKAGLQQRAAAVEKVLRYDDWMRTHVRRGGWLKGILFWPIEPSEEEIEGAAELVSTTLAGYDALAEQKVVCGSIAPSYDSTLTPQQMKLTADVAEYLQRGDIIWQKPPLLTIVEPIKQAFPC